MNWDSALEHDCLSVAYGMSEDSYFEVEQPNVQRTVMQWALSRDYIRGQKTLHPRRTMDQFYYSSLINTNHRDSDQTISKWTGLGVEQGGRQRAHSSSRLIMVDQLWCWVLDDSKFRLWLEVLEEQALTSIL
jgi:hypothetical protein